MPSEKMVILKMLEDGKITAESAANLLAAIGNSEPKASDFSGRTESERQDEYRQTQNFEQNNQKNHQNQQKQQQYKDSAKNFAQDLGKKIEILAKI